MAEHDKDKDKHDKDKDKDKHEPTPADDKFRTSRADNTDQDPKHPSNVSQPKDMRPGAERDRIEGAVYSSDNLKTEQEKGGLDPVTPAEDSPGPVETIQDQGIGPRTPYPTGDPPQPHETSYVSSGIKGVTDKPAPAKPDAPAPRR